jgi:hypothetical protein
MANDETFQGTFEPPTIGSKGAPIALAGTGSVEVTPDMLIVKGFHGSGALLALATLVLVTGAGVGAVWLVTTQIFHHASMSSGGIGGAIGAGVLSAAAIPKSASKKPWELSIPWSSVKKVTVNLQRKDVEITIKKHKPSGVLHFKPTDGATQIVCNAIQTKILS